MDINGSFIKEELKDKNIICKYCQKKSKYKLKSGDKEIYVCEKCYHNV